MTLPSEQDAERGQQGEDKPASGPESRKTLQLVFVHGFVRGWAKSKEQLQALLMLIGGDRNADVARAMGWSIPRVSMMWMRFMGAMKSRLEETPVEELKGHTDEEGDQEEGEIYEVDGDEEGLEDERIEDTSDDDEGEEAGENARW